MSCARLTFLLSLLSIIDAHEEETVRRRDHAAVRPVARLERGNKVGGAPFARADMLERAHH